jgi:hypothetical protein
MIAFTRSQHAADSSSDRVFHPGDLMPVSASSLRLLWTPTLAEPACTRLGAKQRLQGDQAPRAFCAGFAQSFDLPSILAKCWEETARVASLLGMASLPLMVWRWRSRRSISLFIVPRDGLGPASILASYFDASSSCFRVSVPFSFSLRCA